MIHPFAAVELGTFHACKWKHPLHCVSSFTDKLPTYLPAPKVKR